jgi:hypothetical protein
VIRFDPTLASVLTFGELSGSQFDSRKRAKLSNFVGDRYPRARATRRASMENEE